MSWIGTVGALLISVAVYGVLACYVTEDRFVHSPQRYMSDTQDAYPFLKAAALRIAGDHRSGQPYRVVLIGDSGIREALTTLTDLRSRVTAETSRPVEVTALVAGGLSELDAVDLCGILRGHMRGRVILAISPYWIAKGLNDEMFDRELDRLGLDTTELQNEFKLSGRRPPVWSNNFFIRNIRFMLAHSDAFVRLLPAEPEPPLHALGLRSSISRRAFVHESDRIRVLTHAISHRTEETIAVYTRLIRGLRESGVDLTLIEAPINPRLLSGRGEDPALSASTMNTYAHARGVLCKQTHTTFWDLDEESALTPDDFHDAYHVVTAAARVRFTKALAAHIAASVNAVRGRQ